MKKLLALTILVLMLLTLYPGCAEERTGVVPDPVASEEQAEPAEAAAAPVAEEPPAEPVTLLVAGGWPDCRALDVVAAAFTEAYPNCTVQYEYVQDYYASLAKRMTGDGAVDIFFTSNIQEGSDMLPFALDLYGQEALDLSQTFDGLIENFMFREEGGEKQKLYAVPLGAEMRGLYVNTTLLDSLQIAVPTNQAELLAACETLKQNGYIAFHGNPGTFSQTLLYPWICNLIANADDPAATHAAVEAHEPGLSEMFREPYTFLYTLVENGYYDYKRAQTDLGLYTDATDEAYACNFLNIVLKDDAWVKGDDVGQVAFMPAPMSLQSTIAKTKEDYHSTIEYVFMPAPVGPDGGFVYLSPAHGIAVNNSSLKQEWALKFLDFLFQPENNAVFAETFNVIPNTKDAFSYVRTLYDVPDDRISHLGQVTFGYGFYNVIQPSMIDASKANNPKYMQDDGKGNLTLVPLDSFIAELEASLQQP